MTPPETVQSIDQNKRLVDGISEDKAMSTVFTNSFDLLKSLCTKEINTGNFEYDLELMEMQRNLSRKHDPSISSGEPIRKLVYALSEAIQRTAQVLIKKNHAKKIIIPNQAPPGPLPLPPRMARATAMTGNDQRTARITKNRSIRPNAALPEPLPVPPRMETAATASDQMKSEFKDELLDDALLQPLADFDDEEFKLEDEDNFPDYSMDDQSGSSQSMEIGMEIPSNPGEQLFCCPLCSATSASGRVQRSLRNLNKHLRDKHKKAAKSLLSACACGFMDHNLDHVILHGKKCNNFSISILRSETEMAPTLAPLTCYRKLTTIEEKKAQPPPLRQPSVELVICPFCRSQVERSLRSLQQHLLSHHKRTVKKAGLCFLCACGFDTQQVNDASKHKKTCRNAIFTMHRADPE
ncbi:hypothetical protein PENTCL1PPCAC_3043 [Pristionchus entomophagus]|uniref:C2H2-type domain-containing protein n=1 Tax=Pristionchus entomophagus TaxID=358040 RepID=A0AAV5SCU6_9BILA|nr:hypothetical protein PENTCL1PPCAC_3043 [Pristionchus entomophagus]